MADVDVGYALSDDAVRKLRRAVSQLANRAALKQRDGRTAVATGRRSGAPVSRQDLGVRVTSNSKTGDYYPGIWAWYDASAAAPGWLDNPEGDACWVYPANGGVCQTGRFYHATPSNEKAADNVPVFVAWPDEALPTTAPTLSNNQAAYYFDPALGEFIVLWKNNVGVLTSTVITLDGSTYTGGSTGAPVDAEYLVLSLNADLTAERRLVVTSPLDLVDGGANADATLSLKTAATTLAIGGTPSLAATPGWFKVTATYTDFATGATTNTKLLFNLPASGVLHAIVVNHTTAFTGGALANYRVSVGRTASGEYTAGAGGGRVIFTAPADPPTVAPGVDAGTVALPAIRSITGAATTAINAYVTGDAVHNLNVATQGSCDFFFQLSQVV